MPTIHALLLYSLQYLLPSQHFPSAPCSFPLWWCNPYIFALKFKLTLTSLAYLHPLYELGIYIHAMGHLEALVKVWPGLSPSSLLPAPRMYQKVAVIADLLERIYNILSEGATCMLQQK